MDETEKLLKLHELYAECVSELTNIGIDILDESKIGKIDIGFAKRKVKRYGCCKQNEPDNKFEDYEFSILEKDLKNYLVDRRNSVTTFSNGLCAFQFPFIKLGYLIDSSPGFL